MKLVWFFPILVSGLMLGACASTPPPPPAEPPPPVIIAAPKPVVILPVPKPRPLFEIQAGTYTCELDRRVVVHEVSSGQDQATLQWGKRSYEMQAVKTATGALRLENKDSGLTWITIVGKSMLLDTKNGRQLANECRV